MMKKLEIGKRYVYLITTYGHPSYIEIPKQYIGIYSGIDENNNLVFKNVEFTHVPYTKKFKKTNEIPAKIPVARAEMDKALLPLDPFTDEPFEINSIEDVESAILKLKFGKFEIGKRYRYHTEKREERLGYGWGYILEDHSGILSDIDNQNNLLFTDIKIHYLPGGVKIATASEKKSVKIPIERVLSADNPIEVNSNGDIIHA